MPRNAARWGAIAIMIPRKKAPKLASQNPPGIVTVVLA